MKLADQFIANCLQINFKRQLDQLIYNLINCFLQREMHSRDNKALL